MLREQQQCTSELIQPQCIITDGDAAIKAAIKIVWPLTYHLLCIWHIIDKNATENLKKAIGQENSKQTKLTAIIFIKSSYSH
jgi:transposase-like protein